jgi:hypothetical protein
VRRPEDDDAATWLESVAKALANGLARQLGMPEGFQTVAELGLAPAAGHVAVELQGRRFALFVLRDADGRTFWCSEDDLKPIDDGAEAAPRWLS